MEQIGAKLPRPGSQLGFAERSQTGLSIRRTSGLPVYLSNEADLVIPRKTWSNFKEDGRPRMLRRALEPAERAIVEHRRAELAPWMEPFHDAENDMVALSLIEMFSSFSGARDETDVAGRVELLIQRRLAEFPEWAITRACNRMGMRGYTRREQGKPDWIERHWPPSDPEIVLVVEEELRTYKRRHDDAVELLAAEVER